jgi:hypothetical protein
MNKPDPVGFFVGVSEVGLQEGSVVEGLKEGSSELGERLGDFDGESEVG